MCMLQHILNKPEPTLHITGTHIAYYFVCARKLWLYHHGIQLETESDSVRLGKHIHRTSYKHEEKEVDIDGIIVVDWIDHKKKMVHEVKKSAQMEHSHQWQLKYYLWYLEQKGLPVADEQRYRDHADNPEQRGYIGELNYPKLRQTKTLILKNEDREKLVDEILPKIERICSRETPPRKVEWAICKSCAYQELCYS